MLLAMAQPATAAAESLAHAIRLSMASAFLLAMLGLILASALFLLQLRVSWQQALRVGVAV